ncbi:MAG: FKBP-type peptidyl-prolyl cis-trans isomerase [Rhodocyclaceae bacterium]|nr:FKBP-type peptidyl-prolyl cis-trans isomerase [Rhodocyclaceae bacterium]
MKKTLLGALALASCTLIAHAADPDPALSSKTQQLGYSIGLQMGASLRQSGMAADMDALVLGLKDALSGREPRMSASAVREAILIGKTEADQRHAGQAAANLHAGERFLADNGKQPGVITTASGLQYKVLTAGTGRKPTLDSQVTTHYTGTLRDGTEFDSSRARGAPATFTVNGVIEGWKEALPLMSEGARWLLYIPSNLAYASEGVGRIGPNEVLIFDVELLKVE